MSSRVIISFILLCFLLGAVVAFRSWVGLNDTKVTEPDTQFELAPEVATVETKASEQADYQAASAPQVSAREDASTNDKSEKLDADDFDDLLEFTHAFKEKHNITPADEEEFEIWSRERGLGLDYGYDNYSVKTLKGLANQGDIVALDMLANSIRSKGRNLAEAEKLYIESAVRGSLHAIDEIASIKQRNILIAKNNGDDEHARALAAEALAWMRVGELRGNLNDPGGGFEYFETYMKEIGQPLDSDIYREAETIAGELYNALEAERMRLGFDEFDNSIPTVFKKIGLDQE
ncbi:hypothetical protein [Marinimicrobium sp. C2-29]|uniref:hypothetical protein n=1 Tax=Marinimicrobium sp. C2-29 TaxID=3139825 RepID=UPI003138CF7A